MTKPSELTPEDRELVERVAGELDDELNPEQQIAFDSGVRRRIARRRRRPWLAVAVALPTAATALALALMPGNGAELRSEDSWLALIDSANEVTHGANAVPLDDGYDWLNEQDNEASSTLELDAYSAEYQAIALWLSPTQDSDTTSP